MPDASVSVLDAVGASVAVDTWETGGQHRQVVVLARPAAAARSRVTAATADTLLLAANPARATLNIYNDSTAVLFLALGAGAASATSYTVQVPAGAYYEKAFAGEVRGIWAAANGAAQVTEETY